ncbi:hypothetical protein [Haloferula sp. BvORR071]|nr:hypothetical protein [Haloferula sp. BvORR071]
MATIISRMDGWSEVSLADIVLHYSTDKVHHGNNLSDPPPGGPGLS